MGQLNEAPLHASTPSPSSRLDKARWAELFPDHESFTGVPRASFVTTSSEGGPSERFHFSIATPRDLRRARLEDLPPREGILAAFVDDRGAEIAIYGDEVAHELSPADWAELRLERLGHQPWATREQDTPIGRMADLLTRRDQGGSTVIARTNAVKDGKRIFTIVCAAPEARYRELAASFFASLATFQLTQPEGAPRAEALLTYSYLEPAIASLMHPASFELMADGFDEDTFDVRLDARTEKGFLGSLHATVRKEEAPGRFVAEHFARLDAAGIRIDARGPLVDARAPEGFARAFTLDATGTWGTTPVLVQALVLVNDAATVLLATTGPTRAHDGYGWAVSRRALQIARDTVYAI